MGETKIGLIICSTRTPRVGPNIASWIASLLSPHLPPSTTLHVLDLASHPLPISPSGPELAARLPIPLPANPYDNAAVNAWSATIAPLHGFIFVTPQYNWSFPAVVKIAIDHLFHEWGGKPALVVSYGGRGGGKANAALREVWKGIKGGESIPVELSITGEGMQKAQREGTLTDGVRDAWDQSGKGEEIVKGWGVLVDLAEIVRESGDSARI